MQRIATVCVLALSCAGCLRSTTTITLRADGSGTIVQENGVSPQALAMLKSFAPAGEQPGSTPPEMFGEQQAIKTAATMGVKFVSGEPIKTANMEGYRANYSFDDITQLKMKQAPSDPMSGGSTSSEPPFGFAFERRGASSLLTIQMPPLKPGSGPLGELPGMPGAGEKPDPQANQQAMAMMKMMMQGLFVDITLAVDGRIIKTNAQNVEGSRITLMQVDFDQLLADETTLQKLQGASDFKALANIPGLKVPTEPTVTIEFAR